MRQFVSFYQACCLDSSGAALFRTVFTTQLGCDTDFFVLVVNHYMYQSAEHGMSVQPMSLLESRQGYIRAHHQRPVRQSPAGRDASRLQYQIIYSQRRRCFVTGTASHANKE